MWRLFGACFLGFIFLHDLCASDQAPNFTFVYNASSAPAISYYDYIIIGGGTAGCPLAATLSQNASVLLLERGGSPYGNPNITNLANFGDAMSEISPTSPAQRFKSEDGVDNARGRVLGGGSCINAGFYTRAGANYTRRAGWDVELVNASYEWVEKVIVFEPILGPWQSAVKCGLLEAGVLPYNGFTYDHIYGTKIGGSIFDNYGHRHSAADLLCYAKPSGITVLLWAPVYKILFKTEEELTPIAHGVVFQDELGINHTAYLNEGSKNEIILSAGTLGSPQILILSGLGPVDQLEAHNITIVKEQPMVGQLMADNPMNSVYIPSPLPVETSLIQLVGITHFGSYIESSCGTTFGPTYPSDSGLFSLKVDQQSAMPPKQRTPRALKVTKLMDNYDQDLAVLAGGNIYEKVTGPKSTGYLELKTRNPNDNPSVTFNYFKDPQDLQTCIDGMSTVVKVIDSDSFAKFRFDNISTPELLNVTEINSTTLEQYCKDTLRTIWHYHGGCNVGTVVDTDYKVLGVDKLRVIDASTFNATPGTNPQATIMMLGRYMGVRILSERLESERKYYSSY